MSVTIRITESMRDVLKQIANQRGVSMQAVLETALHNYRKALRVEELNLAYASMSPGQMADYQQEVESWERATLRDDLDPEDIDY